MSIVLVSITGRRSFTVSYANDLQYVNFNRAWFARIHQIYAYSLNFADSGAGREDILLHTCKTLARISSADPANLQHCVDSVVFTMSIDAERYMTGFFCYFIIGCSKTMQTVVVYSSSTTHAGNYTPNMSCIFEYARYAFLHGPDNLCYVPRFGIGAVVAVLDSRVQP